MRPETLDLLVAMLNRRRPPGDPLAGLGRRERRPRPPRPSGPGADRRGRRASSRGGAWPAREALAAGRARARHPRGQGGPGPHQRHPAHDRASPAWRWPRRGAWRARADVIGALTLDALQGHRRGLRPAHPRRPAASRARAPRPATCARPARGQRHSRVAPRLRHACRTPTACAACPRSTARRATRSPTCERTIAIEMNAATDNPMVFAETGELLSGGNFHGEPVAMAADVLAIAVAELGVDQRAAHRAPRQPRAFGPARVPHPRMAACSSGLMIAHVTAAALASENKALAHPASVDSIPTSANKEDHVSMGVTAARKAARGRRQHAAHPGRRASGRGARPSSSCGPSGPRPRSRPCMTSCARRWPPGTRDRSPAPEIERLAASPANRRGGGRRGLRLR